MKLKLGYPVKFKKVKLPSKKKLIGKYCNLEPINIRKHSKDLFKNFSLDQQRILKSLGGHEKTRDALTKRFY